MPTSESPSKTYEDGVRAALAIIERNINEDEEPGEGNADEDTDIYSRCGGNFDDAYQMGMDDGEQAILRSCRDSIKKLVD